MKRRAFIYFIPAVLSLAAGYILYQSLLQTDFINRKLKLQIEFDASQQSKVQLFTEDKDQFKSDFVTTVDIAGPVNNGSIDIEVPIPDKPGRIRIDPSFTRGNWVFRKITLAGLGSNIVFGPQEIFEKFKPAKDIKTYKFENNGVSIESNGPDSNIISTFSLKDYLDETNTKHTFYLLLFLLVSCLGVFVFYIIRKKLSRYIDVEIKAMHLFVLIFTAFLLFPFLWMNLFSNNSDSGENRKLHEKPVFNFDKILEYPKLFNQYFDDNFGFRKELSTLNSYYKLKIFETSSKPDLVAVGKKSWLFSTDPTVIKGYQNETLFTDAELKIIQHNLEEAYDWHTAKNINFFVMILPMKSSIYPEYLPDCMKKKSEQSKLLQLRDYMKKNSYVKIIDVTNELIEAKSRIEVYYQHDIHWNFQGGYIGYEKLITALNAVNPVFRPTPRANYWTVARHTHSADLGRILSLENILLNDEWHLQNPLKFKYEKIKPVEYGSVATMQSTVHTQIKNSNLPKAVVYRDSYFNLMIPYFSEHFSDCIYLWTNELSSEVIEKEKPSIVVYEMLESSIDKLLEDNPTGIRK